MRAAAVTKPCLSSCERLFAFSLLKSAGEQATGPRSRPDSPQVLPTPLPSSVRRTRGRADPGPRSRAPGSAILQCGRRAQRTGRKPGGETEGAREGGGEAGTRKDGRKERRKLCCVCIPCPSSPPSWRPTPQIEVLPV